ncbi:MAG: hypothetical protein ACREVV_02335 [Steroidobacteraceae bacterium]
MAPASVLKGVGSIPCGIIPAGAHGRKPHRGGKVVPGMHIATLAASPADGDGGYPFAAIRWRRGCNRG